MKHRLEQTYQNEIIKNEKYRAILLVGLLFFEAIFLIFIYFIAKKEYFRFFETTWSIYAILIFTLTLILYEIFVHYVLFRSFKKYPFLSYKIFGYFNSFSEVSLLTLLLFVIAYQSHSVVILHSPATLTYFIFIVLSVFRLDFRLSVFTGILSAIEYVLISLWVVNKFQFTNQNYITTTSEIHFLGQALIMLITGIAAGFAAEVIRSKMISSWKNLQEKMEVIHLFGQQISQEIAESILQNKIEQLGKRKKVTIMFLDIRNFTGFVESHQPEEVVKYLNTLFDFMIEIVLAHKGVINQFLGDGFMATFGAPVDDEQSAEQATKAAKEIIDKLIIYNNDKRIPHTRIGIGLHYDEAVTGNIGSPARKQFSITGRVVIMASRIEQLNKKYQTSLLISKEVFHQLNKNLQQEFIYLDNTLVKGSKKQISLYHYKKVT